MLDRKHHFAELIIFDCTINSLGLDSVVLVYNNLLAQSCACKEHCSSPDIKSVWFLCTYYISRIMAWNRWPEPNNMSWSIRKNKHHRSKVLWVKKVKYFFSPITYHSVFHQGCVWFTQIWNMIPNHDFKIKNMILPLYKHYVSIIWFYNSGDVLDSFWNVKGVWFTCFGIIFWFAQIIRCNTLSPPYWMIDSLKIINWVWSTRFEILSLIRSNKTVNQNHDFESWFRFR